MKTEQPKTLWESVKAVLRGSFIAIQAYPKKQKKNQINNLTLHLKQQEKEGHYIMTKGSIQEEDITIINIYAPNIGAPQYIRQMLTSMKGKLTVTQ